MNIQIFGGCCQGDFILQKRLFYVFIGILLFYFKKNHPSPGNVSLEKENFPPPGSREILNEKILRPGHPGGFSEKKSPRVCHL